MQVTFPSYEVIFSMNVHVHGYACAIPLHTKVGPGFPEGYVLFIAVRATIYGLATSHIYTVVHCPLQRVLTSMDLLQALQVTSTPWCTVYCSTC